MSVVGAGVRQYEFVENWPTMPEGATFGQVVEIVVDAQDRVFIFHRGETSPMIFSKAGDYLGTWEANEHWQDVHGVCIGADAEGEYLIVVDRDRHLVSRCNLDGAVAWSVGTPDTPGRNGAPFDRPTDAAIAPNGDVYVSDGYGNARVHQFSARGEHIRSWGSRGIGQGQFNLPHAVRVIERQGKPELYVCDRENQRIQIFTLDGEYVAKLAGFKQPGNIIVDDEGVRYVAELQARVTLLDRDDFPITRIGGEKKAEPGFFVAPHTVWLDSEGSLYVGEVLEGQRVSKFKRV
jgi:hypothetical protein